MKRRLLVLAGVAALLCGFTLYSFEVQTQRVRWHVAYQGAAYNTATPESTDFRHCFYPGGYTQTFGHAFFRTKGFQCSWSAAGSGGTTGVVAQLVHEDAGVDCKCNLGACNGAASTDLNCTCEDGGFSYVQLGRTLLEDGGEQTTQRHCFQLSADTDCAANPSGMTCSIDLFR